MNLLRRYMPDALSESVYDINYKNLYDVGYRGLIFDIDGTLVPHGADTTEKVDALFTEIHNIGFKTLLLSNNSEARISDFNRHIQTQFIPMADKPDVRNFHKAVERLDLPKDQIIVIGDQLFTDIDGANKCGLANILVKFLMHEDETKIGKKRRVEQLLLKVGKIFKIQQRSPLQHQIKETDMTERKPLSERYPKLYDLAVKKETAKRYIQDLKGRKKFAQHRQKLKLPNVVHTVSSYLIKKGPGIDPVLQTNKADNIDLAASKIDGIVINPGEEFSFWKLVGKINKKNGYKDGRVIVNNQVQAGMGGGICNLANNLHLLVIHSPLQITEFHAHSDALAPDQGERKPFQNGTSVSYNYVDYRFKNPTSQKIQICLWVADETLYGELRSEEAFPWKYHLVEENHRFVKENGKYYRKSKIYKVTEDAATSKEIDRELLLDNRSEVMFDYDLIPEDQIKSE